MAILTESERLDLAARVSTRWRRWRAHAYYETIAPPLRTIDSEYPDVELLYTALTGFGIDLLDATAPNRAALRAAFDGLVLRVSHAFAAALEDPRTAAEIAAIEAEIRGVIDRAPNTERN